MSGPVLGAVVFVLRCCAVAAWDRLAQALWGFFALEESGSGLQMLSVSVSVCKSVLVCHVSITIRHFAPIPQGEKANGTVLCDVCVLDDAQRSIQNLLCAVSWCFGANVTPR